MFGTLKRRVLAALALAAGVCGPVAAQTCDRAPILVRGALLWSPDAAAQPQDVLFRDGKVAAIGAPRSITPPDGARVIEGEGQTLLPGLIDLHLHFNLRGLPPDPSGAPRDAAAISGRQLLRSGVTSGRLHLTSLTNAPALKARAAAPCARLPRLKVGGPGVAGGAPERNDAIMWGVRSAEDAAEKMRRLAAAGVDWVAVHDAHRFPPADLAAVVAAARANGLRVMGAAEGFEALEALLAVRPDTLDYVDLTPALSYPEPLAARLKDSGATLVPTVGYALRLRAFETEPGRIGAREHVQFMSAADGDAVIAAARRDIAELSYIADTLRAYPTLPPKLAQLRASGAPVAMGTDVGSSAHFQAGGIWWELEAWRRFGADPDAALRAATRTAAQVLGDPDAGVIAVGAHADFLLYDGDVREGPFDLRRLRTVAKDGVLYLQEGLWVGG